ncbi:MAG: hypothetical protein JJT89_04075 [Nitriliruptoraceae bacterium]|nr:hypothetical protein [Nitriliruptoraceae bacterium]
MVDELLVYPTDRVVGIAPDRDTLDAVHAALGASGVADDRVEVLCGEDASHQLDADGDEGGLLRSAVRTVQQVLGEETERLRILEQAVDAGGYVVKVALPDDLEDEAFDTEKRAVGNALHDAGATNVAYYGPNAIEELQLGA